MKKLLVTLVMLVATMTSYGQIPKQQRLKDFGTWSVSPFASATYTNFDLDLNDPFYTQTDLNYGWGLSLSKQLSHFSGLKLTYSNTTLKGAVKQLTYETAIQQIDARMHFNLTNGQVLSNWRNTQFYAYVGYGMIMYDTKQTQLNGIDTNITVSNNTRVLPAGVGFKYRLGNRTSLFADVNYSITNTDNLDGWSNALTAKDGFTQVTAGLNYTFGKKKVLEWDNPYQYLVPDVVHDTTTVIQRIEYVPPVVPVIEKDSAIVYFTPGSWEIEMPYLDELDKLIDRAVKSKQSLLVQAYVDATGAPQTNMDVVTKRGDRIAQYIKRVLPADLVVVELYDETFATYAPNARNRKVVVKLIK